MIYTVYELTHIPSGKCYIGVTSMTPLRRLHMHFVSGAYVSPMHTAMERDGFNAFQVVTISAHSEKRAALAAERREIIARKTYAPFGFNYPNRGAGPMKVRQAIEAAVQARAA